MSERERYGIVTANNMDRDCLVVELSIGEDILFEFYIDDGERKLAIYTEHGKSAIVTSADVFQEAIKAAYKDALTLPDGK
ncbi:hypothetical protein [Deinococcus marmoris]|uniref:hypothetical protein n=1 Tax=Deinococcus marmoris TaxID=249408 RepID=UPI0012DE6428|nr:hypothetical protein [Deinococcus marmoris]